MSKKILLSIFLISSIFFSTRAEAATTTDKSLAVGVVTASSSDDKTAKEGLCTMSNGNTIPCIWKDVAEKDLQEMIANGGVRKPVDENGIKMCDVSKVNTFKKILFSPSGYLPCESLSQDGSLAFGQLIKFFYKNLLQRIIFGIVIILIVGLILVLFKKFLLKKKEILPIVFAFLLVGTTFIFSKMVFADIPALPTTKAFCTCVTNDTDTCVTEASDHGMGVRTSCNATSSVFTILTFTSTGNNQYASTARESALCCTRLLGNYLIPNTTNPVINPILNSSTVVASHSLGWDTLIPCDRQGGSASATLHFTGYKMEPDPGGGVGHGNGTGSTNYPRATYSCYVTTGPVNGACNPSAPNPAGPSCSDGAAALCSSGPITSCTNVGNQDGLNWTCGGVNGGTSASCSLFWCFTGETLITMADGSKKAISELKLGDAVIGQTRINHVIKVRSFETKDYIYSINGSKPFVTGGHPFMTKRGWMAINPEKTPENVKNEIHPGKMVVGDYIQLENGEYIKVEKITPSENKLGTTVYNPGFDGDNTYYANSMLVHNK